MSRPGLASRFAHGAAALPRAFGFVLRRPSLWPLVLAPSLLALAAVLAVGRAALHWGAGFLHAHVAHASGIVNGLLMVALFAFVAAVAYLAFLVIGFVVTAPFSGPLSKRTEKLERGEAPEALGFFSDVARSIVHVLLQLAVYLSVSAALLLGHLIVPPLAPVTAALGLGATAIFLAWDGWDPPLSRRGASFGGKWSHLARHLPEALGFGTVVALVLAVPGLGLIVPPVAAVAGTRLYLALEREA